MSNLDAKESGHPKRGVIGIRLGSWSRERVGLVQRELCAIVIDEHKQEDGGIQ